MKPSAKKRPVQKKRKHVDLSVTVQELNMLSTQDQEEIKRKRLDIAISFNYSETSASILQLQNWCQRVMKAYSVSDIGELHNCLIQCRSLGATHNSLEASRADTLLKQDKFWAMLGKDYQAERQIAICRWAWQVEQSENKKQAEGTVTAQQQSFASVRLGLSLLGGQYSSTWSPNIKHRH